MTRTIELSVAVFYQQTYEENFSDSHFQMPIRCLLFSIIKPLTFHSIRSKMKFSDSLL